jgi:hypothetical protein
MLININNLVRDYLLYLLAVGIAVAYGWLAFLKSKQGAVLGPPPHQSAHFRLDRA